MILNIISVLLIILAIGISPYLFYYDSNDFSRKFRKVLIKAIIKGEIKYADLKDIAAYWQQGRESVLKNLRRCLYEHFNEENGLENSYELIRSLLDTHKENESSDELPESIYYQLELITDSLESTEQKNKIKKLAASISPLYSSNNKKVLKERRWSYIIGIPGTIVAVVAIIQYIVNLVL